MADPRDGERLPDAVRLSRGQLARQAAAEFIGTAFLLIAIIGSGIAAQRLSPRDSGLELLENAVATGAALVAIILAVGSVSGAHLNPAVSAVDTVFGGLRRVQLAVYVAAQVAGAVVGAVLANAMYSLAAVSISTNARASGAHFLSEVLATFGLILVVFGLVRARRGWIVPFAVGAYITGAYFFASSTSFANPAVTLARMLSDTFAGIAPASVPSFIAAQLVGGTLAAITIRLLWPNIEQVAGEVIVPRQSDGLAGE